MPICSTQFAIADRMTIILRPRRSATEPQSGETKAETRKLSELKTPDQNSTALGESIPSSGKYSGKMGLLEVCDALMMNCTRTIIQSVRCQLSGSAAAEESSASRSILPVTTHEI